MIEKIKLSELKRNWNPDITAKIPIIKPDGGMEYSTIFNILSKSTMIGGSYTIEPGKYISVHIYTGIIWIKSSLGSVAYMGGCGFEGGLLTTNDNYCNVFGEETPGKINVYNETGGEYIYIENYTNATVRVEVNGIGIQRSED